MALVVLCVFPGLELKYMSIDEPLALATQAHNHTKMKWLLAWGADPNASFDGMFTALAAASKDGDIQAVQILLDHGADPNFEEGGCCPMNYAKDHMVRELLISHGGRAAESCDITQTVLGQ